MYMQTSRLVRGARRQAGFTLAEILVTVGIVGIITAIGMPSLSGFLRSTKLNSISGALAASLQQGRSEAVNRNQGVLVCASNSAGTACNTGSSAINWGVNGWLVCYDQDADSVCDDSTTDLPNPIRREGTVDATFAAVTGPVTPIRFSPTGTQGAAGSATVTISITGTWTGATALTVTVAATGLIKGNRV